MKSNGRTVREQLRWKIIFNVQFIFRTIIGYEIEPLHNGHLPLTTNLWDGGDYACNYIVLATEREVKIAWCCTDSCSDFTVIATLRPYEDVNKMHHYHDSNAQTYWVYKCNNVFPTISSFTLNMKFSPLANAGHAIIDVSDESEFSMFVLIRKYKLLKTFEFAIKLPNQKLLIKFTNRIDGKCVEHYKFVFFVFYFIVCVCVIVF